MYKTALSLHGFTFWKSSGPWCGKITLEIVPIKDLFFALEDNCVTVAGPADIAIFTFKDFNITQIGVRERARARMTSLKRLNSEFSWSSSNSRRR